MRAKKDGVPMIHKRNAMLQGPLLPAVIRFTVPIILTSVLQLLFNTADLVVVGRFCGSASLAAVGNAGAITGLFVHLFIGISVGVGVTVAQGLGARDSESVRRTVQTTLPTALICSVILTVLGISFAESLLRWMGTPEDLMPLSVQYVRICFAGITFSMVYNFCAAILRATGDTKSPLIYLTVAGIINVILNVVFVTAFGMNVAGVALATTLSQGVSAVLVLMALMKRTDECRLVLKEMKLHKKQLLRILRIGLPAGIQTSLFSIANLLVQASVNSFGEALMSANAASGNIEGFLYAGVNAFQQTAMNFAGQNAGAKNYRRAKQVLLCCLGCAAVAGTMLGVGAYLLGPQLLSIYITDSPEAIYWGVVRMAFVFLPYALCGMMDVTMGALRGMGVSLAPTLIAVIGICGIRVGWIMTIFQIPRFHTPQCLYFFYPLSWALTFAGHLLAFMLVYRKRVRSSLQ